MSYHAVIGAGYGDEGKGMVVSHLCQSPRDASLLVVRFCGGHQAGHHVMANGKEHVFSNFGSGTLQGHDTFWSKFCTIDPAGIMNEIDELKKKRVYCPSLYIDERCPVTTPFEKEQNILNEKKFNHGTCGVGIGATFAREQAMFSITALDLKYPDILLRKIDVLKKHYYTGFAADDRLVVFWDACKKLIDQFGIHIVDDSFNFDPFDSVIFEGSQGLMLDQNIGFFPHVTRGNTDRTNILKITDKPFQTWVVTRAYQTRHGEGPLINEGIPHKIKDNPYEQNFNNGYQGEFRKAILDIDTLEYALKKAGICKYNLVVTCLDCVEEYAFTAQGKMQVFNNRVDFLDRLKHLLRLEFVYTSETPYPEIGVW